MFALKIDNSPPSHYYYYYMFHIFIYIQIKALRKLIKIYKIIYVTSWRKEWSGSLVIGRSETGPAQR